MPIIISLSMIGTGSNILEARKNDSTVRAEIQYAQTSFKPDKNFFIKTPLS